LPGDFFGKICQKERRFDKNSIYGTIKLNTFDCPDSAAKNQEIIAFRTIYAGKPWQKSI